MTERPWTALFLYPAPLYAGLLVLSDFWGGGVGLPIGFAVTAAVGSVTAVGLLRRALWVWVARLATTFLVLIPLALVPTGGGLALDLAAGAFLASPLLWVEYAWKDGVTAGARVVALELVFLVGIVSLATVSVPQASAPGSAGYSFFYAFAQVLVGQLQGVAALLTGGAPTAVPLESALDVVYVALAALALGGCLVSWLVPRSGREEPLPWSWTGPTPTVERSESDENELGLRPGQREALAGRTLPVSPSTILPPGFGAVISAVLLVTAFIVLAVGLPSLTLFILALGVILGLIAVGLVLARPLEPVGRLEG